MENCLQLSNVIMRYDQSFALDNLSFEVYENEIFGFLGPSGAGKTTTIKLLTKQLKKQSGNILVFGTPIEESKANDNDEIGVLSDTSGCYERMTIEENLLFFAKIRNIDKSEVENILRQVNLYDERKKMVKKISKGMKQRTVLACALIHHPKLLFLDEPTSGLDPATANMIHELLLKLRDEKTTIFLTTHNMEEADKLCDRVAFLENGKLIECGSPVDLKLKYAKDELVILTKDREMIKTEKGSKGYAILQDVVKADNLLTVHSTEPNLEDIFLQLTGRKL